MENIYPVSPYQKRFWLDSKINPQSKKYNTPLFYEIKGNLNIHSLEKALFLYVKEYHTANCHYFKEYQFDLLQVVHPIQGAGTDTGSIGSTENTECIILEMEELGDRTVNDFLENKINHIFDLKSLPLFKFSLLKVQENHFILSLNFHHIITDAFTGSYLVNTVSELYNHFEHSEPLPLKPQKSFTDYLDTLKINEDHDQNFQNAQNSQKEEAISFWKENLAQMPLSIDFFEAFNKQKDNKTLEKVLDDEQGASYLFQCDPLLFQGLKIFAKQNGTTIFIVLASFFALTLARYSRQKTIVLTYPINTRQGEFVETPGSFVNNVPFRIDCDNNDDFIEFIKNCTLQRKKSKAYQYLPLTDIIHALQQDKKDFQDNYFNASILEAFLNPKPLLFKGLEITPIIPSKKYVFNDLSLYYQSDETTVQFRLDYKINLQPIIQQFIHHFLTIIKKAIDNPLEKILSFSLLSHDEMKWLHHFNDTHKPIPNKDLFSLFSEQVVKNPSQTAVIYQNKAYSYQEIYDKALYIAHQLKQKLEQKFNDNSTGVATNNITTTIGIYLEKSLDSTIAILAILSLNKAYLNLSTGNTNFSQSILEDAKIKFIITNKKMSDEYKFLSEDGRELLLIEERSIEADLNANLNAHHNASLNAHPIEQARKSNEYEDFNLNSLAYIIYTSGTTGKPKGIMIEQKSVINVIEDFKTRFAFSKDDSLLSITEPTFDIYGLELFLPLLTGGKHIIAPKNLQHAPEKFIKLLKQYKPTFLQATPSFFAIIAAFIKDELKETTLLSGGEVLTENLAQKLHRLSKDLWNLYGPSETTIYSSVYHYKPVQNQTLQTPYIGKPIQNTSLYVLDEYLNPVPKTVLGELYIGGLGLAKGYINNEALTNQSFIIHPKIKERLYKTNDFVRLDVEGELDFVQRFDKQIKIRGHRVELAAIEAKLLEFPGLINVVVKSQSIAIADDGVLIAYYVLKKPSFIDKIFQNQPKPSPYILKEYLKKYLPDHMIPIAYVEITNLPLTSSGKLDEHQLPKPTLDNFVNAFEPTQIPLDVYELQLQMLWSQLINLKNISILDDFFMLGGNSLLAVFLLAKIEEKFKVQYHVPWLLKNRTIKDQANFLRKDLNVSIPYDPIFCFNKATSESSISNQEQKQKQNQTTIKDSNLKDRNLNLFLIHPGLAGSEVYLEFSEHFDKNFSFYAIDSYNLNSNQPFLKRIEDLAAYYINTIQKIQSEGPYFIGGWSLGGMIAYEMAQQLKNCSMIYLLDTELYSKEYLQYMGKNISLDGLMKELPKKRANHLQKLPKTYLNRVLASLKNDVQLLINYSIKPYTGNVTLYRTIKKTKFSIGLLEDKSNGFKPYVKNLNVHAINTDHLSILEGDSAKELAYTIKENIINSQRDIETLRF